MWLLARHLLPGVLFVVWPQLHQQVAAGHLPQEERSRCTARLSTNRTHHLVEAGGLQPLRLICVVLDGVVCDCIGFAPCIACERMSTRPVR